MKQVKAVVRPEKLAAVRDALKNAGCYHGGMVRDIYGQGTQMGITQTWQGEDYHLELVPKAMLDLVIRDDELDMVTTILLEHARTGAIGDGKIFVYNVENVIRIRTGEEGEVAI